MTGVGPFRFSRCKAACKRLVYLFKGCQCFRLHAGSCLCFVTSVPEAPLSCTPGMVALAVGSCPRARVIPQSISDIQSPCEGVQPLT